MDQNLHTNMKGCVEPVTFSMYLYLYSRADATIIFYSYFCEATYIKYEDFRSQ